MSREPIASVSLLESGFLPEPEVVRVIVDDPAHETGAGWFAVTHCPHSRYRQAIQQRIQVLAQLGTSSPRW